jgi:hypothetical protein
MHPKVAAFASLFPPFIRHAKTDPLRNAKTLRNSQVFLPSPYLNLPTQFHEDPQFFCCMFF